MSEFNGDVVLSGEGSLDMTGMTFLATSPAGLPAFNAGDLMTPGVFSVGSPAVASVFQANGTGPNFLLPPPGVSPVAEDFQATSASGDIVGISFSMSGTPGSETVGFVLPVDYVSGSLLSGTATFGGETLQSMRLAAGDYAWNSGTNSISLSISAIPEPMSCVPLAALSTVWLLRRRRLA